MKIFRKVFLLFLLPIILFQFSCKKQDKIDSTPGLVLSFSTDTVFFDTVFPSIGSVTHRLIVYNPNKNSVSVSKIVLAGGSSSRYRINVDGSSGTSFSDLEIPGMDSIFIFVKVTIDPHNADIPYVVSDSIQFMTNGTDQFVKLVAWGRDAIFYKDEILKGNHVWDSTKAHVIFGSVRIDTSSTLTIMQGTRVYFHYGGYMVVSSDGQLKIQGNNEHLVCFQGDRLDPFYRDLPGQWQGIFLEEGSKEHEIDHAVIKNGNYGLVVDREAMSGNAMLTIKNTIIQNMTGCGIRAVGTSIKGENVVLADCGKGCFRVSYGGNYDFRHLTVGNYWYASVRKVPSIILSNYDYDTTGQQILNPLENAYFGNAIIFGSENEEIGMDTVPGIPFNYFFENSLLRTDRPISNSSHYESCLANEDPVFVDISKLNYQIDSVSPAIDKGKDLGIPFDIRGTARSNPPDLGAYEYRKKL